MGTSLFALALLCIYGVRAQVTFIQSHHVNLTQSATLQCSLNGTSMLMAVNLDKMNDTVQAMFARNNSDHSKNSLGLFDTFGNGITGMGTTADPYTFEVTVDCSATPPGLDPLDEQNKLMFTEGTDVASIVIIAKSIWDVNTMDMFNFADDVIYKASCNCSNTGSSVISTGGLTVFGDNTETLNPTVESAVLEVRLASNDSAVSSVEIGTLIYLALVIGPNSTATGAIVYSCAVCDAPDCLGTYSAPIILANGCSAIVGFFTEFDLIGGVLRINSFNSFQFAQQVSLYFQCSVDFCYDVTDPRCPNFCTYNMGLGRKKRQAPKEPALEEPKHKPQSIFAQLNIVPRYSDPDGNTVFVNPTPDDPEDTQTLGLIVAVVTLAGLLLISVVVSVAVFFHMSTRHNKQSEKFVIIEDPK